jgi:hypothetical protein
MPANRQMPMDDDLYVTGISHELRLSDSDGQMRLAVDDLPQAAQAILPNPSDSCAIQIIPFETTLILDTRDHLQPQALLRIRITHCRGLDQPAGPAEARTLQGVEEKLQALGVQAGGTALVNVCRLARLLENLRHWTRQT